MRIHSVIGMFVAALTAFAGIAHAATDDVFVVPRIPVQASGATATAAKDEAQAQGRRRAIDMLLRRLTPEEDWVYLPSVAAGAPAKVSGAPGGKSAVVISPNQLVALESGFEVYDEKASSSNYRAYITYRFKPDAVRRLLKGSKIPYSEAQTRVALVLPVLQTDKSVYLWESNNPWMAAWKSRPYTHELTPFRAPLGDLEDSKSITARQALDGDGGALATIADRYGVSQIIVAHARVAQKDGSNQLSVRLVNSYRETGKSSPTVDAGQEIELDPADGGDRSFSAFSAEDADFAARVGEVIAQTFLTEPVGNFPSLAERAIDSAIAKYSSGWKARTLIDHSKEAQLPVTAFFESIEDWSRIRSALIATPLVGAVQVSSLSRRGAEMDVRIFGDPQKVQVAMENQGIVFWSETGERWFLATPAVANKVRGRRFLRERRGLFGMEEGAPDGPTPANAVETQSPDYVQPQGQQ